MTAPKKPAKRICPRCGKKNAVPPARLCPTCKHKSRKASREKSRDSHAQKTYGLKPGDLTKLDTEGPNGPRSCYICGGKGGGKLATDHDHEKVGRESVRGRLCYTCNTILLARIAHDDVDRLEWILGNAIRYLEEPPGQKILNDE